MNLRTSELYNVMAQHESPSTELLQQIDRLNKLGRLAFYSPNRRSTPRTFYSLGGLPVETQAVIVLNTSRHDESSD